jgi:hypothetical protein
MNDLYLLQLTVACFDNDNDAFIPEKWAMEGLAVLQENNVMANLVHRDYSMEVANFGDVVNTRRPGKFRAYRKTDADSLANQDASSTNVQVPLDQHFYVSYTIKDGEASKSFQDLVQNYIVPGMQGIARGIDRVLCGQAHRFLNTTTVGKLDGLDGTTAKDYLLEVREQLNKQLAYPEGRRLVVGPDAETSLLKTDLFLKANERGDGGNALREAALGRVLGFDTYMDQNQPGISSGADAFTKVVETGPYAIGADDIAVNASGATPTVGSFVTLGGEMKAHYLTTGSNDTLLVLDSGLRSAVVNDAVATVYDIVSVDMGANLAAGYSKGITLANYATGYAPQVGQLLAFGTTAVTRHTYTIIEAYVNPSDATETIVWLDRPLDLAVLDGADAFPGPQGSLSLAFHRDALALVTRPLALPNSAMGVRAAVASYDDIAMRVTMQYDITQQGTIVCFDILAGVALLDVNLGCVLLG